MAGRMALNHDIRVRLLGPELEVSTHLFDNCIVEDEGVRQNPHQSHCWRSWSARPPEKRKVSVRFRGVGPRVGSKRWRCTGLLNRRTWVRFPPDPRTVLEGQANGRWQPSRKRMSDEP